MNSKSKDAKITKRCRQCRSEKISYRMYGFPAEGTIEELSKQYYKVETMGCCITGDEYTFHCLECDFEWNPPDSGGCFPDTF